jgi:nickel-dependent lactate racemase
MKFSWGFGYGEQEFEIPDQLLMGSLEGRSLEPLEDIRKELKAALIHPIASPPLQEVVHGGDRVLIIAPDYHRVWLQLSRWLPVVVEELHQAGVPDRDISLLIATGTHRKPGYREILEMLGKGLVQRVEVVVHDARDPAELTYLGKSRAGTPIWVNRRALQADKVILTGGIVSHTFAGFGGGRKVVVPGIAGMKTILANHRLALSSKRGGGIHPQARPGILEGNPVSEDMMEIAERISPSFLVNVVVSESGEFLKVFAGDWIEAHRRGCRFVEEAFKVPLEEKADIVLATRGGHPMDLTFYQAFQSNANAQAALKEKGILIMVGKCSQGLGPYEFHRWFDLGSAESIEEKLREEFTVPGFVVYRAALLAKKVRRVMLVSSLDAGLVRRIGIIPHQNIQSALEEAWSLLPGGRVLLMPHASQTIPYLACDR